jgi:hypothetical protein
LGWQEGSSFRGAFENKETHKRRLREVNEL